MKVKFALGTVLTLLFAVMFMLPVIATAEAPAQVLATIKEAEPVDVDMTVQEQYMGPVKDRRWPLVIKQAFMANAAAGPAVTEFTTGDPTFMVFDLQTWFGNLSYNYLIAWRSVRRGPTGIPGAGKIFPGGEANPGGIFGPPLPLWWKTGTLAMPGTYRVSININGGMPENWQGDYSLFVHLTQGTWKSVAGFPAQDASWGNDFSVVP